MAEEQGGQKKGALDSLKNTGGDLGKKAWQIAGMFPGGQGWCCVAGCGCFALIIVILIIMIAMSLMATGMGEDTAINSGTGGIYSTASGECIDNFIRKRAPTSPLIGHGSTFIAAGNSIGVDPILMVAIAGTESSFATDWAAIKKSTYNYASLSCGCTQRSPCSTKSGSNRWEIYSSWDEAITKHTQYIYRRYISKGIKTIPDIGHIYCENANADWIPNVTKYYNLLQKECPAEDLAGAPMATQCTAYPIKTVTRTNNSLHGYSVYKSYNDSGHNCFHGYKCSPRCGDAVDLYAPTGTPVYAPFSGTCRITLRNRFTSRENIRIVSDDGTMDATLAHIYSANCNRHVTAGQVVGRLRPLNSGAHLHFELWVNNKPIAARTPQKLWASMKQFLSQKMCQ